LEYKTSSSSCLEIKLARIFPKMYETKTDKIIKKVANPVSTTKLLVFYNKPIAELGV
jgi:lauroyl/myristoyl acyltransferase